MAVVAAGCGEVLNGARGDVAGHHQRWIIHRGDVCFPLPTTVEQEKLKWKSGISIDTAARRYSC